MSAVFALNDRDSRLVEAPGRAARLAEIDVFINNLKTCLHWLVEQGLTVISVDIRRGKAKPQIEVSPAPRLHILFKDDCANVGRRQDGALTRFLWIARRFYCDIHWEEVICV